MDREDLADVLSEFARTMVTDFPIEGTLEHLVERIVDVIPISAAGVTLIGPGLAPRYIAVSNESAERYELLQTELGEGPCLAAYSTGGPVCLPDLSTEEDFPSFVPRALEAGLAAVFAFPLRHGNRRLGALDLYREAPGVLPPDAVRAAETLADVVAAYLLNAQARADLEDSAARSVQAALHDGLTGLPNRLLMFELLEHAFMRSRRSAKTSALFFLDIDHFKLVNDTYGHRIGDEVLVAVTQRLTETLRPGDTLARLSGDEFVILCEDLDDHGQADAIAVRISSALTLPLVLADMELSVTASIGIAFAGGENTRPDQLLHDADVAMYRTKRRRGASPQKLDLRELHLAERQAGLERSLAGAAQRGELDLAYQPVVAATDGRLIGVEALLRWTHPDRGLVSPSVLIPLAEQSGLIVEIGRWVLERAWAQQQEWQRRLDCDFSVAVNVSTRQLMSAGFADTVAAVLVAGTTDPRLLTLEMTESVFVADPERALVVLGDLKEMGVTLALDDFGTGYSSLAYLLRNPIDIVKTDRAFITNVGRASANRAVMTAVIQLAHTLGMTVVSEGVETPDQHDALTQLSCDFCQGFYFGRPTPASGVDILIQDNGGGLRLPLGSA